MKQGPREAACAFSVWCCCNSSWHLEIAKKEDAARRQIVDGIAVQELWRRAITSLERKRSLKLAMELGM